ncbi:hypothetical protein [Streptococcus cuniculi]|nr:hypothetical protein [Streptococcus cuniculi]
MKSMILAQGGIFMLTIVPMLTDCEKEGKAMFTGRPGKKPMLPYYQQYF